MSTQLIQMMLFSCSIPTICILALDMDCPMLCRWRTSSLQAQTSGNCGALGHMSTPSPPYICPIAPHTLNSALHSAIASCDLHQQLGGNESNGLPHSLTHKALIAQQQWQALPALPQPLWSQQPGNVVTPLSKEK